MEPIKPKIVIMNSGDDIFRSPARALVVPVNKVGVMGNGLALAFKLRVSGLNRAYINVCRRGWTGRLFYYAGQEKEYLCFATKNDWRHPSKLDYIEDGMAEFVSRYRELGITSVAFPAIGCGKGNLVWDDVLRVILRHLESIADPSLTVYIYPPT